MKIAFYEKEITPPLGSSIPGYFNVRLGSDVKDRLYAKSMVIQSGETTVAILAADGCLVPSEMHEAVAKRVEQFTGIKKENLILHYIHTHTGIPTTNRNIESAPEEARYHEIGYFDVLSRLLADCVTLAYHRLEESKIFYACGVCEGISFCRDYYMKDGIPRTNPPRGSADIDKATSAADPSVPVLFVEDEDGNPKGALISFGCHLDCVDGTEYSGDFSSVLSKEMKKQFGEDFVTVFMMGLSGNVNHFDVTKTGDEPDHYIMMGKTLFHSVLTALSSACRIEDDTLSIESKWMTLPRREISEELIAKARHIVATVKMAKGVKLAADGTNPEQYNLGMSKSLLRVVDGPSEFDILIQAVRIGSFALYSMPGEPYLEYGTLLKEKSPTKQCLIAAVCNKCHGYIPTPEMLQYDTIYSARIGANRLVEDAGFRIVDALAEMAHSIF